MDKKFVATLHGATRKNNSADGNPTWQIHTSEGDYLTQTNASIGYDVDNHTNSRSESWVGKRVEFTTTDRKRITDWRLASE